MSLTNPPPYIHEFAESLHDSSSLVVIARGVGFLQLVCQMVKCYSDPAYLLLLIGFEADELHQINHELQLQQLPVVFIMPQTHSVTQRRDSYLRGGVVSVTHRMLLADLLTRTVPVVTITGLVLPRAERTSPLGVEEFIAYVYREQHPRGFVLVLSEAAWLLRQSSLRQVLTALKLRATALIPRFHTHVKRDVDMVQCRVTHVRLGSSESVAEVALCLRQLLLCAVEETHRHGVLARQDGQPVRFTMETAADTALVRSVRHSALTQHKPLLDSLLQITRTLHTLFDADALQTYLCVRRLVQWGRTAEILVWPLTDACETLVVAAKRRVFVVHRTGRTHTPHIGGPWLEVRLESAPKMEEALRCLSLTAADKARGATKLSKAAAILRPPISASSVRPALPRGWGNGHTLVLADDFSSLYRIADALDTTHTKPSLTHTPCGSVVVPCAAVVVNVDAPHGTRGGSLDRWHRFARRGGRVLEDESTTTSTVEPSLSELMSMKSASEAVAVTASHCQRQDNIYKRQRTADPLLWVKMEAALLRETAETRIVGDMFSTGTGHYDHEHEQLRVRSDVDSQGWQGWSDLVFSAPVVGSVTAFTLNDSDDLNDTVPTTSTSGNQPAFSPLSKLETDHGQWINSTMPNTEAAIEFHFCGRWREKLDTVAPCPLFHANNVLRYNELESKLQKNVLNKYTPSLITQHILISSTNRTVLSQLYILKPRYIVLYSGSSLASYRAIESYQTSNVREYVKNICDQLNINMMDLFSSSFPTGNSMLIQSYVAKKSSLSNEDLNKIHNLIISESKIRVTVLEVAGQVDGHKSSLDQETSAFETFINERSTMVLTTREEDFDKASKETNLHLLIPKSVSQTPLHRDIGYDDGEGVSTYSSLNSILPSNITADNRNAGKKTNEEEQIIIVDARELRSSLCFMLYRLSIRPVILTLEMGDYLLAPHIAVERKSLTDFIQSLQSGRLASQLANLSTIYENPFLLLEWTMKETFGFDLKDLTRSLNLGLEKTSSSQYANLRSKLCIVIISFPQMRLFWSRSPEHTANLFLALKLKQQQPVIPASRGLHTGISMLGTDDDDVKDIDDEKDESKTSIVDSPINMLLKMPGVTSINSKALLDKFDNLAEIATATLAELNEAIGYVNGPKLYNFLRHDFSDA